MTKDEARARTAFEAARAQQEKIVQAQPDYGPALCVLGLIDAALGRKDLALDEGRRAIALTPLEKDVINGSRVLQYFAITAAWAGDKELALQQLEAGLRAPAASIMLSYGALKLFPFWDPLRGDPRFEKIVASLAPKECDLEQVKSDNFFAELKRRNVYRAAVAYGGSRGFCFRLPRLRFSLLRDSGLGRLRFLLSLRSPAGFPSRWLCPGSSN